MTRLISALMLGRRTATLALRQDAARWIACRCIGLDTDAAVASIDAAWAATFGGYDG